MGGAGGSLRSGATRNPVRLTRSVQQKNTSVTSGGVPAYVWPGGGITMMVNVLDLPDNAFGYVPTPAIVAPLEFTVRRSDYRPWAAMRKSAASKPLPERAVNMARIRLWLPPMIAQFWLGLARGQTRWPGLCRPC